VACAGGLLKAPSSAHPSLPGKMGGIMLGTPRRLFLLLALGLAACTTRGGGAGPIVVVDDAGDTLRLAAPARRIVSLIPASTELLFAVGAGAQVVGRTHWCDYPAAALRVTDVGDGIGPNLEAVVAQEPDLVLLYLAGSNAAAAARLRALGIAVVQLRTDALASVPGHTRLLGTLTGHPATADSVVTAFELGLDSATVTVDSASRPSVLILAWDQPPMAIGAGSYLDELVHRAGGSNLFHDLPQASAPVSLEAIAERDPRTVLTMGVEAPAFAARPEWQVVPAVREKRFLRIHGTQFDRPGPRTPTAIRELAALLAAAPR
jgi:iron complex transport system substrate-binding protein